MRVGLSLPMQLVSSEPAVSDWTSLSFRLQLSNDFICKSSNLIIGARGSFLAPNGTFNVVWFYFG